MLLSQLNVASWIIYYVPVHSSLEHSKQFFVGKIDFALAHVSHITWLVCIMSTTCFWAGWVSQPMIRLHACHMWSHAYPAGLHVASWLYNIGILYYSYYIQLCVVVCSLWQPCVCWSPPQLCPSPLLLYWDSFLHPTYMYVVCEPGVVKEACHSDNDRQKAGNGGREWVSWQAWKLRSLEA